jgi:UDP-2-acetamido-2,6-beta-L-arabino-hexul-4-ose reductase
MRVLVTGAEGFIGRNLLCHLNERKDFEVVTFTKRNNPSELRELVKGADAICHLAGVNRPTNPEEFKTGNADLTEVLCQTVAGLNKPLPFILASSTQAASKNPYGESKRRAELLVQKAGENGELLPYVFRLPNVFGKWCKPNYNSAVATFCHNIVHGLPITVNDAAAPLKLVYIDDLVSAIVDVLDGNSQPDGAGVFSEVRPVYTTTVGHVADMLKGFQCDRQALKIQPVGTGLHRALYATYVSYLPQENFSYSAPRHADARGVFVEMLKTESSGQFSFFTAHPGITRGGHYHHTKTEKFLVIKGTALYRFRNVMTGEAYELRTTGDESRIVDTAPGWVHDITNVGDDEMIVMLWANEVFDREKPDTYARTL